jgi:hypothetical protein
MTSDRARNLACIAGANGLGSCYDQRQAFAHFATLHAVRSVCFTTAVLALSINCAVSLI